MAPNLIKSSSQLSLDLSNHINFSLEAPVSAYPPLIDADIFAHEADQHDRKDSFFAAPVKRSNSVIFNLLVKDEALRAVSCENIEANLIADTYRIEKSDEEYYVNENMQEEESYWDMPSDCDNAHQEEDNVLSTAQVERSLVEDALRRIEEAKQGKDVVINNHPNNAYWDWPSEPTLESEKKAALIASVLMEESIRQKLSIDSITNNEVSNKVKESPQQVVASENVSTDYWFWNSEEETKEEVVAPHVNDPSHPNHAYWDYPSGPTNAVEERQKVIDDILKEDRIRELLSSKTTEEREVNFHRSKQANKDHYSAPKHQLESIPENYWDFNASSGNDLISVLSQDKQALINRILKEEQMRYIVSTENIENHLVASKEGLEEIEGTLESVDVSASYWDW